MLGRQSAGWRPLDALVLVGLAILALLTFRESLTFAFMGDDAVVVQIPEPL